MLFLPKQGLVIYLEKYYNACNSKNCRRFNNNFTIRTHILNPLFSLCDAIHHLENGSFQATYLQPEFEVLDKNIFNKLKMETDLILQQYL